MRLAGSALIFSRLPLEDALARIRAIGLHSVELAALEGWAHINPSAMVGHIDETVARYTGVCVAAGLEPIAINASLGKVPVDEQEQRLDALAAVAARLGAQVITLNPSRKEESLEVDLDRFRRLVPIAQAYGVALTVETHYFMHTEDPAVALRYAEAVPGLGVTLDPSHYAIGPYWEQGFATLLPLLPYVRHVHLRPAGQGWAEIQLPVGQGVLDFPALLALLKEHGYDGNLSIEYVDTIAGLDHTREAARLYELIQGLLAEA